MTPQQYDQLKAVIQKAVPGIMELNFGCEVQAGKLKHTIYGSDEDIEDQLQLHYFACLNKEHLPKFPANNFYDIDIPKAGLDKVKILGRPIRLADCIYALTKSEAYEKDINRFIWKWNFLDDNLDHQTDETKQFLFKLLVGG